LQLAAEVLYVMRLKVHGGAPLKMLKMLSLVVLALLATSTVRADDTRVNNNGGGDPDIPACGSNPISSNSQGVIDFSCLVTSVASGGTGALTTITDEAPDSADGGALTCASQLVTVDGWSETSTVNPGGIDTCTLTAPKYVSLQTYWNLLLTGDPYLGGPTIQYFYNDGDCDLDDFVLGIPVGCTLNIDNFNVAGNPNSGTSPFAPNTAFGVAGDNSPLPSLPEPGTLSLLLIGLTGLPFVRRMFAR
jgi:hypothetical protein